MRKKFFSICAFILCTAMLSSCNANESGSKTETVSNSETTISAENTSATVSSTNEPVLETTVEETEVEEQINYQKKRVITYPADGGSYVSKEYEYEDDCCYKETSYNSDGSLYGRYEYKNDIIIKSELYYNGFIKSSTEYDGTKMENIVKISQYNDNQELIYDMIFDYQFNDDFTEALETTSTIYYETDFTSEPQTYVHKYEYEAESRIIHKYNYLIDEPDSMFGEQYYEYDDNGNMTKETFESLYSYTREYDDNGNMTKETYETNSSYRISIYEYDEYGRQIGWTEYDADGNETSHTVVEYD